MKSQHDTRKLLKAILPFVIIMTPMVLFALLGLYISATARAITSAESLWAKGQRDAVYFLERYSWTRDPGDYYAFLGGLEVQRAFRDARLIMDAPAPDYKAAKAKLLAAGLDEQDVPGVYTLFVRLRNVQPFKDVLDTWTLADRPLRVLPMLGARLRQGFLLNDIDDDEVRIIRSIAHQAGTDVREPAREFARLLGNAFRPIFTVLSIAVVLLGLGLLFLLTPRLRRLQDENRQFSEALHAEKNLVASTLDAVGDAVIGTDLAGNVTYLNTAARAMLAGGREEHLLQPLEKLCRIYDMSKSEGGDLLNFKWLRTQASRKQQYPHVKLKLLDKTGTEHMVSMVLTPVPDLRGKVGGLVLALRDKSVEMQYLSNLSWQASHDALTGLYNRREFEHRLDKVLQHREEFPHAQHALLFVDLDQFKLINDTHGHSAGDELLKQIAQLLVDTLDSADLVARLGGDEFGVLLSLPRGETAQGKAARLLNAIDEARIRWQEVQLTVTASIGIVALNRETQTLSEAMQMVDIACYLAKERGRNRIQTYGEDDAELKVRSHEMGWVQRLRDALEEDRLCLYAQEVVPIHEAAAHGRHFEVLIRLYERDGTIIPPVQFIPAAERFGLMPEIDRFVITRAFETLAMLRRAGKEEVAFCSINLSGTSFGDESLLEYIRENLKRFRVAPGTICFEITETAAIGNLAKAESFISALKSMGCHFALDDFGVGMSSFGYLKRLDVDYLKIDGSFVKEMLVDQTDRTMVEMINNLGHVTGKKTIAEFVGSAEILEALKLIGVDYAQGFHVGKPQPFSRVPQPKKEEPSPPTPSLDAGGLTLAD